MGDEDYSDLLDTARYKRQFGDAHFVKWLNDRAIDRLNDAFDGAHIVSTQPGSLYKVDLPDDQIAKMLDWDKPLSQQPKEVQEALQNLSSEAADLYPGLRDALQPMERNSTTGQTIYHALQRETGNANNAAKDLRTYGIPGIRYLDGGSRGTGQGTSNFVVFPGNENLLTIIERNGQPMGGLLGQ